MPVRLSSREKLDIVLDLGVLSILLFVGMTSAQATVIASAVLALSYLGRTESSVVYSMMFFYPFFCIFKTSPSGSSFYNLVMVIALIRLMITFQEGKRWVTRANRNTMNAVFILFLFCTYLFILGLLRGRNDFMKIAMDLLLPLMFVIAVFANKERIDLEKLIYAFSIAIIIAGAVGAGLIPVKNLSEYVDVVHYKAAGIRLTRFQGLTVNPNYFSLDVNMAMAGLLVVASKQKKHFFTILLMVLLFITGMLTVSKSFIVCFLAMSIIYMMMGVGRGKPVKLILLMALLVGVFAGGMLVSEGSYLTAIMGRLKDANSLDELTSERSIIWSRYLKYIFNHFDILTLGVGAGGRKPANMGASHSFFIECLYYFGILGCTVFAWFHYSILKTRKFKMIYVLPLITFLIRGVAINIVQREAFATDLILIVLFMHMGMAASNEASAVEERGHDEQSEIQDSICQDQ